MLNQKSKNKIEETPSATEIVVEEPLADVEIKLEEPTSTLLTKFEIEMFEWLITSLINSTKNLLALEDESYSEFINLQTGLDLLENIQIENIKTIEQQLDIIQQYTEACVQPLNEEEIDFIKTVNYIYYDPRNNEYVVVDHGSDTLDLITQLEDILDNESYIWMDDKDNIVSRTVDALNLGPDSFAKILIEESPVERF